MKVSFLIASLMLSTNLEAGQNRPNMFINCEVRAENGVPLGGLTVELNSATQTRLPYRIPVMLDGSFECRNIEVGDYDVRVFNARGEVLEEDAIWIRETGGSVLLHLREPMKAAVPDGSGVVSIQRLMHPTPSKAEKEFQRSAEATRTGDVSKSIEHLQKALSIFPDYMEAHNNLGVAYMNLNQFDGAVTEFQKAVALDSASDRPQLNLGLALLAMGRHLEAESAIRRALTLVPRSIAARYALGQVLFGQGKSTTEALESLQMAADQFPYARLLAANLLLVRGAVPDAINQLQRYLDTGRLDRREEVRSWLDLLKRSSSQ